MNVKEFLQATTTSIERDGFSVHLDRANRAPGAPTCFIGHMARVAGGRACDLPEYDTAIKVLGNELGGFFHSRALINRGITNDAAALAVIATVIAKLPGDPVVVAQPELEVV